MQRYLKIIGNGQRTARDLTPEEAQAAFTLIMEGQASLPQVAVFMTALRINEESAHELAVFAHVLRRYCNTLPLALPNLVDVCVPYDGRSRLPSLIPAAALIAATAGAKVILHGRCGQNTPPKFGVGVGDILSRLGINVMASLDEAADVLQDNKIGLTYVDSTTVAPALERFNQVRFDYGMRSFFNTIEKLMNPFNAPNGMVGVFHGLVLERVAQAMQAQGYQRGLAIQGSEGAIDVLTSRRTPIIEFGATNATALREWSIDPTDFGWWERLDEAEMTVTHATNAALTQQLLDPANEPQLPALRRSALLTAALILYTSGKEPTYEGALSSVQSAFASREPAERLARWRSQLVNKTHNEEVHHVR